MSPASYRAAPPRVGSGQPYVTSSTKPNRYKERALLPSIKPGYGRGSATADCPFAQVERTTSAAASSGWVSMASWLTCRGAPCRDALSQGTHGPPGLRAAAGLGRLSDRESDPCHRLGRELSRES